MNLFPEVPSRNDQYRNETTHLSDAYKTGLETWNIYTCACVCGKISNVNSQQRESLETCIKSSSMQREGTMTKKQKVFSGWGANPFYILDLEELEWSQRCSQSIGKGQDQREKLIENGCIRSAYD